MTDASNICLSCGLCCDGTLIGFVELSQEELPAIKKIMKVETIGSKSIFLQPCDKFCDGCTIYSNRPHHCESFKCDLLNAVEEKAIEFNTALHIIATVKQQKRALEKEADKQQLDLKSKSFTFRMMEMNNQLEKKKSESQLTRNQKTLQHDLKELDKLVQKRFGIALI